MKEKNKKYRNNNKDYYYEYNKNYRKENKEDIKEYKQKYYEEHKEERKKYNKQWRKDNPEKILNQNNKRRTKEENQGNGITKEQWLEMMNFFDWKCAYSGEYIGGDSNKRTIDHIIALDNGGEHEIWNLVPMLKSYNSNKHTKDILEWYLEQDYFDIDRLTKIYEWRVYAYWKYR